MSNLKNLLDKYRPENTTKLNSANKIILQSMLSEERPKTSKNNTSRTHHEKINIKQNHLMMVINDYKLKEIKLNRDTIQHKNMPIKIENSKDLKNEENILNLLKNVKSGHSHKMRKMFNLNNISAESFTDEKIYLKYDEDNLKTDLNQVINLDKNILYGNQDLSIKYTQVDINTFTNYTIENIKEKIKDMRINLIKKDLQNRIDIDKLMKISYLKVLQFMGSDLSGLFYSCTKINHHMKTLIKIKCREIIEKFSSTYKDSLHIVSKSLIFWIEDCKNKNRRSGLKSDLKIKAEIMIPEKFYGNSFIVSEISQYIGDKNLSRNTYKFDYQRKNLNKKVWIMKEFAKYHFDEYNKPFVQPILSFSRKDIIEISINLLSERGFLDFSTLQFIDIQKFPIPKIDTIDFNYFNHKYKEITEFNLSRICEHELIKNKWVEFDCSSENKQLPNFLPVFFVNQLTSSVSPYLKLKKAYYDLQGLYFIKLHYFAVKEGYINMNSNTNEFCDIEISIKKCNESISNELKKNCLMFYRSSTLELRIGDEIIFYCSKSLSDCK